MSARSAAWSWPPLCGAVSGWAGVGIARSQNLLGFAADGERALLCGAGPDACDVYALKTGAITDRVSHPWPNGLDGTPVASLPPVAKWLAKLSAPAPEGRWPYPDDLRISWRVGSDGASFEITLLAWATGDERVVAQVTRPTADAVSPSILEALTLSPDGATVGAQSFSGQGGRGFDVVLINVHAEAAALFSTMGPAYATQAAAARRAGAARAPTFEVSRAR